MWIVGFCSLALSLTTTTTTRSASQHLDRRALLSNGAAAAIATITAAAALATTPTPALAAPKNAAPTVELKDDLLLILRVQEASGQEARLVRTGKYRELQRLNIKRAIGMMIDNYDLRDRFVRASAAAPSSKLSQATEYANNAVENLIQVLEYFPADLIANDLTRTQKDFVLAALDANSRNIDSFLALMPSDEVQRAKDQLVEENRLNLKEFDGKSYLNSPTIEQDINASKEGAAPAGGAESDI